jgi:hypothetical protein
MEAKPRDHSRVSFRLRVDRRDARVASRRHHGWATDSEQLRCMQQNSSWIITLPQLRTLSSYRVDVEVDHLFKPNCGDSESPFDLPYSFPLTLISRLIPTRRHPTLRTLPTGVFWSKLTSLKRDRLGSQAHPYSVWASTNGVHTL